MLLANNVKSKVRNRLIVHSTCPIRINKADLTCPYTLDNLPNILKKEYGGTQGEVVNCTECNNKAVADQRKSWSTEI